MICLVRRKLFLKSAQRALVVGQVGFKYVTLQVKNECDKLPKLKNHQKGEVIVLKIFSSLPLTVLAGVGLTLLVYTLAPWIAG